MCVEGKEGTLTSGIRGYEQPASCPGIDWVEGDNAEGGGYMGMEMVRGERELGDKALQLEDVVWWGSGGLGQIFLARVL